MITSKQHIAEQLLRRLRKYSLDSDIDERDIMIAAHQSLGTVIRNRFFQSKNMESQEVDGSLYYTVRDIPVQQNDSDKFYINMPSTSIELPFGVDIKRVGTKSGKGFVPTQNGFNDLYYNLESSCLEGQIGYYKHGGTLEFVNMTKQNKPTNLELTMVLPFGSLDEEDEISIPQDMMDEVVDILFVKFGGTLNIPADSTSNAKDNP